MWLIEKHEGYSTYQSNVPRFFPSLPAFVKALPTFERRSLFAAAAVPVLGAAYAFLLSAPADIVK
jgi:hypothetical protein